MIIQIQFFYFWWLISPFQDNQEDEQW